jgi:hypothetical protein
VTQEETTSVGTDPKSACSRVEPSPMAHVSFFLGMMRRSPMRSRVQNEPRNVAQVTASAQSVWPNPRSVTSRDSGRTSSLGAPGKG